MSAGRERFERFSSGAMRRPMACRAAFTDAEAFKNSAVELMGKADAEIAALEARATTAEASLAIVQAECEKQARLAEAADYALDAARERITKLEEGLAFYANPEIYKPHPHGPAFERRDLSDHARALLQKGQVNAG